MSEELTNDANDTDRVSRLSTASPDSAAADAVVREYEERYRGPREEKPKRREIPRSYSTLRVTDDEKLWAAVAHGSIWITAIISVITVGTLVPVSVFIPLVIYFLFRKRSDYVAFHALQAFVLQLFGTIGAFLLLVVGGTVWAVGLVIALLLMVVLIGFILVPVWGLVGIALLLATALMPLASLLYGTIATIETYNGRDYRYPFISRWVDRQLAGGFLNIV
ncbi:MAG: DUF4870 domain-containing protein [Chloroflexota bacterium]|nr:MAG: hypothetical protein DIU68_11295 [Chloroflexota bacterium]